MRRAITAAALFVIWSFMAFSFPSPGLSYIEQSGCQFCRNDTWCEDAKKVRQHAELKYGYFTKTGRINSTEDFIKSSASKSEMTGKPYLVECDNQSPMLLSQWLLDELERYRKKNK